MTNPVSRKFVESVTLAETLRELRAAGKTIVQCHGCFDIVHPGHIRYLQFARRLGDVLVVSLTGDAEVSKGPDRPYIPQELRAENLAALEFVDWVVIDPRPTACELLATLRPDVYVKGREYATASDPRFLREREVVERQGGRVVFHSGDVIFSSTRLLESMGRDEQVNEHRLRAFCERSGIDEPTLSATLGGFAGVRVVVVGDLFRERYVLCDASSAADDAPVLALQKLDTADYWGGAAAIAVQLQALGAEPTLMSAVGKDHASRALGARLADLGLNCHLFPERPTLAQRCTFVADDSKLFKLTDGRSAPLDSSAEKRAAKALREHVENAHLLVWCDHGYGMVTPGLVQAGMRGARQRGLAVAGHAPGQRGQIGALGEADLLTATERQLREAMHDMGSGLPAVAWNLLARTRSRGLVVSLHKHGLFGFDGQGHEAQGGHRPERLKSEFIPSFATRHIDLLGSEEAILSAASLVVATGGTLPMATYIAAVAEALSVSRAGGVAVTIAELRALLAKRPELRPESSFFPDPATLGDIARLAPPLVSESPV
ncbi:MAG: adenylyltransferase/cytidyltransferase family protein [Planctomycetes bacterium]|nr:adenylyltransferase/cytidyltransferase family protein [Planctomycetota bacterium]